MLGQTEPRSQMSIRQQEMKLCVFWLHPMWNELTVFPQRTEQGCSVNVSLSDVTLTHNNSQIDN